MMYISAAEAKARLMQGFDGSLGAVESQKFVSVFSHVRRNIER